MREGIDRLSRLLVLCLISFMVPFILGGEPSHGATLTFAGRTWHVKSGAGLGPGPNNWSEQNAWVDGNGNLHLKISRSGGKWRCAEVWTDEALGFGRYEWYVDGRIDQLDKNVVLGLFNYGGSDGVNEIDIEFARWDVQGGSAGNFVVYPAQAGLSYARFPFDLVLNGSATTHRFLWNYDGVSFQSLQGWQTGDANPIYSVDYRPQLYGMYVPQAGMPVHINLWLYQGKPPSDKKAVEVVIGKFSYTPY